MSYLTLNNVRNAWIFSSSQYVQDAVKNVINTLSQEGKTLPKRGKSTCTSNYRPEIDTSSDLPPPRADYYQSLVGVLQCITEICGVDITMEASEMSSMMAMTIEGHLEQLFHIFSYLRIKDNSSVVFDPTEPYIDDSQFIREYWSASANGE